MRKRTAAIAARPGGPHDPSLFPGRRSTDTAPWIVSVKGMPAEQHESRLAAEIARLRLYWKRWRSGPTVDTTTPEKGERRKPACFVWPAEGIPNFRSCSEGRERVPDRGSARLVPGNSQYATRQPAPHWST